MSFNFCYFCVLLIVNISFNKFSRHLRTALSENNFFFIVPKYQYFLQCSSIEKCFIICVWSVMYPFPFFFILKKSYKGSKLIFKLFESHHCTREYTSTWETENIWSFLKKSRKYMAYNHVISSPYSPDIKHSKIPPPLTHR